MISGVRPSSWFFGSRNYHTKKLSNQNFSPHALDARFVYGMSHLIDVHVADCLRPRECDVLVDILHRLPYETPQPNYSDSIHCANRVI